MFPFTRAPRLGCGWNNCGRSMGVVIGWTPKDLFPTDKLSPQSPSRRNTLYFSTGTMSKESENCADESFVTDLCRAQVLITEDNLHSQRVLSHMLQDLGIHCAMATSAKQALEMVRHVPYDLVLMDTRLPGMDGIEATERIRRAGGGI